MNMQNLMAQAQKMQRDMQKKQEELAKTEYAGKSEWVELVMNGKKELITFKLLVDKIEDDDDKEMLEDMIKIAMSDAISKVDKDTEDKMGAFGGAMNGLF